LIWIKTYKFSGFDFNHFLFSGGALLLFNLWGVDYDLEQGESHATVCHPEDERPSLLQTRQDDDAGPCKDNAGGGAGGGA
jgi:hypothetical protein